MDINPFIEDIAVALAQDPEIDQFCRNNYDRGLKVYLNFDSLNPPEAWDCPCVMIYPAEKEYGGSTYNDAIEAVSMVHDPAAEPFEEHANIIGYAGMQRVEDLRKLVLRVISSAVEDTEAGQIDSISVDYDSISQFPFIVAAMAVAISDPWRIGSGNPAENE